MSARRCDGVVAGNGCGAGKCICAEAERRFRSTGAHQEHRQKATPWPEPPLCLREETPGLGRRGTSMLALAHETRVGSGSKEAGKVCDVCGVARCSVM